MRILRYKVGKSFNFILLFHYANFISSLFYLKLFLVIIDYIFISHRLSLIFLSMNKCDWNGRIPISSSPVLMTCCCRALQECRRVVHDKLIEILCPVPILLCPTLYHPFNLIGSQHVLSCFFCEY